MCVACLGMQHAQAALEGAACGHCDSLSMRVLRSRLALFSEDGQMRAPRGSGPASAEAMRRLRSWGSQRELSEGIGTAEALSQSSSESSDSPIPRSGARSAASPVRDADPVLQLSDSEELDVLSVVEGDLQEAHTHTQTAPSYNELLEVVTRAVAKLNISWPQERQEERVRSKLDERFLQHRAHPPRRSLPFFPDLHNELCKSWNKPFSARLSNPPMLNYSDIMGVRENGYGMMPRVEEALASYLSPDLASSLKTPALPSKPCRTTSALVGRAYMAAGRAGASLHTMAVLQAYQADLLKDMDQGEGPTMEDIAELRKATDLSLRVTKETARAIGRSMSALVTTERHLWLNLSGIKEKDRAFLLDAPICTSGLFGEAVNAVVDRFQDTKKQSEAFRQYLPRRSRSRKSAARGSKQPQPSSSSYRQGQRGSVASRGPPQAAWDPRQRSHPQPSGRTDLRTVIQSRKAKGKRS
jgi:hypothetical protein